MLMALATLGASTLAVVRTLGPLWLVLIVATVTLLTPRDQIAALMRQRRTRAALATICLAITVALTWTLGARTNAPPRGEAVFQDSVWDAIPAQWVLWFFQTLAAFPSRDEIAPIPLYLLGFLAWWVLVALAVKVATTRERLTLAAVLVAGTAIPVAATIAVYPTIGTAWQGRYAYPFTMGFLLICGLVLDRASTGRWRQARWPVWLAAGIAAAMSMIGQVGVLLDQVENSPLAGTDAWWAPHPALVVALNVAGFALLATALTRGRREPAATLRA
jgi:hypothetical protein